MSELAVPSTHTDLLDAPVATLATVGADGRPQLSALWFLHEDGALRMSLHAARQKTKNMRANPAATLFILDTANPGRYVEVRGDVTIDDDPEYAFADKIGAKYGGLDLRLFDGDDRRRVVVTLNPVKVNAVDMSGGSPDD